MAACETLTPDLRWLGSVIFPYAKPPGDLSRLTATRQEHAWWLRFRGYIMGSKKDERTPDTGRSRRSGDLFCLRRRPVQHFQGVTDDTCNDLVEFEGERFKLIGGHVTRIDDRWIMRFSARRESDG